MSDTPRTDDVLSRWSMPTELVGLCRQLERELAQALEDCRAGAESARWNSERASEQARRAEAAEARVRELEQLVARASEFCDYSTNEDQLEFGIRCCCGTLDFKPHNADCEYGRINAARKP